MVKKLVQCLTRGILGLGWLGMITSCQSILPPPPPDEVLTTTSFPATLEPNAFYTPSPTPLSTPTSGITPTSCTVGRVETYTIEPTPIGKPLRFRVYLPPCYDSHATPGYPVLYLLHGQGSDETLWMDLGLPQLADQLMGRGQIPPFLIVMPYEEYALRDPQQSTFGQTIVENLIPWVEGHFAVCPGPSCRALGGISRGAGWAIHITIQHPDLFAAIGAHSAAPFWGDDLSLYYRTTDYPPEQWPRFYFDSGAQDRYLEPAQAFVNRLSELGISHEWHLNPGAHDFTYWQNHLEDYLRWYAMQWQMSSP